MNAIPAGYKQTEVGVIPEDWTVKPLGSILSKGRLGGNYANRDEEAEFPLMKIMEWTPTTQNGIKVPK